MTKRLDFIKILFVGLLLFIIIFPISYNINFKQDDDWIYYKQVRSILKGNMELNSYIEATFFVQGFMGAVFTRVFSLNKLPVLTLFVSILNFIIFTSLIYKFYIKRLKESLMIGMLFFFVPINIFSMLGFMTENYFLLFFLTTLFFIECFLSTNKKIYFILINLSAILGFFVRQVSIISLIAFILYLVATKRFKHALMETGISVALLGIYFFLFNLTDTMKDNHAFRFENLLNIRNSFTLIHIFLFYAVCFVLPLIFTVFIKQKKVLFISVSLLIILFLFKAPEMFLLSGVMSESGFFTGDALGIKYQIRAENYVYAFWQRLAEIGIFLSALFLFFKRKKLLNYYLFYIFLYIGVMLVMVNVYDRYTLPLVVVFLILLTSLFDELRFDKIQTLVFSIGLILMMIYSYNFGMDFFLLNKRLWDYSNSFSKTQHVNKNDISAGYGWNRVYYNGANSYKYIFNFQEKNTDTELKCCYSVLDTLYIKYPFNFFKDPKVYFYNRRAY